MPENRSRWELDAKAMAALLAAFGSAERYEELRQRLIRFFRWERCATPEDCADEAFNRLAKRLVEGERIESLEGYLHGVARFLVKEERTRKTNQEKALLLLPREARTAGTSPELDCLDACIASLTSEQRDLILRYYEGEESARIRNRQAMARQFGLQMNALRNRALRLRDQLEACVKGCLSKGQA
jgi:DNA-directed RNA polymerase specialized sigma24 family protein